MDELGRRTSDELTEVRTVLSRAESGLERLVHLRSYGGARDLDHEEIDRDLRYVVAMLERYRRTGRPRKK